jgi:hypothetical protein
MPVNTGVVEEIKFVVLENLRTAVTVMRNRELKKVKIGACN